MDQTFWVFWRRLMKSHLFISARALSLSVQYFEEMGTDSKIRIDVNEDSIFSDIESLNLSISSSAGGSTVYSSFWTRVNSRTRSHRRPRQPLSWLSLDAPCGSRALVMGDGVPCYGALEIVGLLLLLLLSWLSDSQIVSPVHFQPRQQWHRTLRHATRQADSRWLNATWRSQKDSIINGCRSTIVHAYVPGKQDPVDRIAWRLRMTDRAGHGPPATAVSSDQW